MFTGMGQTETVNNLTFTYNMLAKYMFIFICTMIHMFIIKLTLDNNY